MFKSFCAGESQYLGQRYIGEVTHIKEIANAPQIGTLQESKILN